MPFFHPGALAVLQGCKRRATPGYAPLDVIIVWIYGCDAPWCSLGWDISPAHGQQAGTAVAMTGEPADAPTPAAGWPQAVGQRTAGSARTPMRRSVRTDAGAPTRGRSRSGSHAAGYPSFGQDRTKNSIIYVFALL
jgi:hypothetical protein